MPRAKLSAASLSGLCSVAMCKTLYAGADLTDAVPNSWFRASAAPVRLADVMIARLVLKSYNLAWRF